MRVRVGARVRVMVGVRVAEGHLQLVGHRHPRDRESLVVARALAPDHRAQRLAVLALPRLVRARARARARVKVRVRVRVIGLGFGFGSGFGFRFGSGSG